MRHRDERDPRSANETLEAATEATVADIAAAFPAVPELDAAAAHGEILNAKGVTKRFGGLVAVHDVDFTIPEGVDRQPHRTERRGQDDVLQHHRRHL